MSKENRPAFLLYASDWTTGTADMSLEEQGIYLKLLCQQWLKGGLPTDIDRICKLVFGPESDSDSLTNRKRIEYVLQKFHPKTVDGREVLVNEKLESIRESERTKFENRSAANSENAKKPRKRRKKDISLKDNELAKEERFANESLTKNKRKEDEYESEIEDENRTENRGVQGGNGEPRKSFAHHVENFITAYGGIKGGNRRAIEVAYIDAVNTMNSEGKSDMAAHELLAIQAARDREYCKQASQTRNNTQNWLTKRLWEKDYDQELKMWQETQENKKTGGNSHGKSKSITAKIIEFNKHTGI